jgi:ribonuclease BN (tRNA processing enzyme)
MLLTFLGTRGNIAIRSRAHARHSALLVETRRGRVMFDCGGDWLGRLDAIAPDAIVLTHAHPDHSDGLRDGAPCPVYASEDTWGLLKGFPISEPRTVRSRRKIELFGLTLRAFPVVHSLLAPTLGYRVEGEDASFFYAPDLVAIPDREAALSGVDLYIGDGASPTRPLVRRRGDALFGHTTIRAQIGWCAKTGVAEAIFTHCGAAIVARDGRTVAAMMRRMGAVAGVRARIARDGMRMTLATSRARSAE